MTRTTQTHWLMFFAGLMSLGCNELSALYEDIPPYQPPETDMGNSPDGSIPSGDAGDAGREDTNAATPLPSPSNVQVVYRESTLRVTWNAVEGADSYEIRVDEGTWIDTRGSLEYEDDEAPQPTLVGSFNLEATRGTFREHALLTVEEPKLEDGTVRTFVVRATRGGYSDPQRSEAT